MKVYLPLLLASFLLTAVTVGFAQDPKGRSGATTKSAGTKGAVDDAKGATAKKSSEDLKDKLVTTQHSSTIGGKEVKYTATAGTMAMKNEEGDSKAALFYVAYTKDGATDLATRPVTFAFNGGPGSASVWLHLGMLGPKRIKLPDDTSVLAPPYTLSNNPHSLLDLTDLVFIDPMSTGYSRPAKGEDRSQFYGYEEDLRSVSQFIHDYVTKNNRWLSPKFLIGESYGGIRASGLSGRLFDRYRISLNGVVLVSPAINFATLGFAPGNDLPFELFVPTYAATAWYHKMLPADLQALTVDEVYKQAKEFATTEYTVALMKGHSLSEADRASVGKKLARFTGLTPQYVESANLRVSMQRFAKELLRTQGVTVGRYDGRYTGIDADSAGDNPEYDPSSSKVFAPFAATINNYLRSELKFEDEHVYEVLTSVGPWRYGSDNRSADGSDTLRKTMSQNPLMKVFLAAGYYDMACPPATATYALEHMRLPPELQKNVIYGYYESGHMIYLFEPAMEKLRKDLEQFYRSAAPVD